VQLQAVGVLIARGAWRIFVVAGNYYAGDKTATGRKTVCKQTKYLRDRWLRSKREQRGADTVKFFMHEKTILGTVKKNTYKSFTPLSLSLSLSLSLTLDRYN